MASAAAASEGTLPQLSGRDAGDARPLPWQPRAGHDRARDWAPLSHDPLGLGAGTWLRDSSAHG